MSMRPFFLAVAALVVVVLAVAGFRGQKTQRTPLQIFPDMKRQPKLLSQVTSDFFADGRADRLPPPGTVPVEEDVRDMYRLTGRMKDRWGDGFPVTVDSRLLARGRERFNINCAVCHGASGSGNGIVTEYALKGIVANFNSDRLRAMADGQIFYTISHGKGQMIGYPHIAVEDRWAIVAYIRSLQLSQNASLQDVPEEQRMKLAAP